MSSILRKRILSIFEYLLFLGLGLILLWLSFRKLDLHEIWDDILQANYFWLLLALVFAILSHIARALRWNLLIGSMGYKTKLSTTFFAVMVGYLANTAVPRMGEFVRCGVLSKKENIPFNALFGTVISERLFDLLLLFLIIFMLVLFQLDAVGGFLYKIFESVYQTLSSNLWNLSITGCCIILLVGILSFLGARYKIKIKNHPAFLKMRGFLSGLMEGIKTIKKLREKRLFLIYSLIIWILYALMVYMPVLMLRETQHLTFLDGLTILAIGSLGIIAPVPGGIGAYHFFVKAVLVELYYIEGNAAGSYAAITHAGQTILNVGLGTLSYYLLIFLAKKQTPLNEKT